VIIQDEKQLLGYDLGCSISNHLRQQIKNGEETDNGATFKPKDKELSKGCQNACKKGSWLCIYLSFYCNRQCFFCTQNRDELRLDENKSLWSFEEMGLPNIEMFKEKMNINKDVVKGISFTGGEPFLQLDKTFENNKGIYEWLDVINSINWKERPYLWVYTNGDHVNENNVNKLIRKGINEIRFDLAASNYSDKIFKKMEMVRKKVFKLGVEVPVLSNQLDKLIGSLKRMEDIGVDYLNLHELQYTQNNWNYFINSGLIDYKFLDKVSPEWGYYIPSIIDVYTVIRYIDNNNINLIYNDCSSINARLQRIGMDYLKLKLDNNKEKRNNIGTWEEYLKIKRNLNQL